MFVQITNTPPIFDEVTIVSIELTDIDIVQMLEDPEGALSVSVPGANAIVVVSYKETSQ